MYKKKKIKLWHGLLVSGLFYILARLFQRFLLTAGLPLLNLIDTGAVQGYISGTLNQSIFQFNLINLEHGLLFVVLLMFWKSIKKSISERNPDEQRKLNLLLLICYFDFLTIPINFVLGVWRGYEVFYVPRLVMWGELIGIVRGKFARGSRWMVTVVFAILFVGWMVFRFYSIWEDSGLMPYIFEPISKYIKK
jgi:hypothetical protein